MSTYQHRNPNNNLINIPEAMGVEYQIDGQKVTGAITVDKSVTVTAVPVKGYSFPPGTRTEWRFVWQKEPQTPDN